MMSHDLNFTEHTSHQITVNKTMRSAHFHLKNISKYHQLYLHKVSVIAVRLHKILKFQNGTVRRKGAKNLIDYLVLKNCERITANSIRMLRQNSFYVF